MGSIKPLPEAVRSSVRSGNILYDLTRVVEELVFNSLDAGATKVYVAIGVTTSFVKVLDNGSGINRDGLVLLGERYATSRYELLAGLDACGSFGFRGEALCSIADVSLLEVITKAHGMPHGYRKVMKGRKCLHIGIDDDRCDVGTTVVVRDLFYNQPVRRKHMQSSPKKVLHSVKKCVLRIAVVHSRVSFRVADIESDDELLSTSSSPSPLQLLSSNFGIEASSSLNELKACEGGLKLSGYISGPFGILSLKAFQYIYINSRFVCKGPIHKMLNQLATSCWENGKFNNVFQYEKRSRLQICPTFVLNLSCPRSLYDITFEPSKNLVEFRDWGPILIFFQNAVTRIWAESVSDDLAVNCEVRKKRCRTQKWQASLDNRNTLPAWRKSLSSCQKSNGDASELEKHQTESLYVRDTDNAVASGSASSFRCGPAKNTKSCCHMQLYDNILSVEENLLGNDYAADNSNRQVDYFLGSRWHNEPFEEDDSLRNMSMGNALSTDCHSIISNAEVNQDFEKPHELSCLRRGSLLHHGPSFTSEVGIQFACDDFTIQQKWMDNNEDIGIGDEDGVDHPSRQDEVKPAWSFSKCTNFHKIRSNSNVSSQDMKPSLIAGECSSEEKYLLPYSLKDVNYRCSDLHSSTTDWIPLASGPLFDTKIPHIDNFIGEDDLKSHLEYGRVTRYTHFPDGEEDCNFTIDMAVDSWDQESCSISSCADFSLDHDWNAGSWRENGKFSRHKFKGSFFPNCSKMFADEEDYGHLHLSCEDRLLDSSDPLNHPSLSAQSNRYKCRGIQVRNEETAHPHKKRSRRSHSAPPFHKHRKKFLALNDALKMATTINNDFSLSETSNLKHPKHCAETSKMNYATQLFNSSCLSSVSNYLDDSLLVAVPDMKRTPESSEIQNGELNDQGEFINDCVEDFASKEVEDILDSGQKWRRHFPETECEVRSGNIEDRDAILDISSGILHLAGDSLVPSSIDKNSLKDARVLQQVDKKFIPVIAGRTLAIIDQHAADERIRLEELRQKVLSGEMKQITHLGAEQELVLPEIGCQLLHNYSEQIQNWGWICNLNTQGSRPFTKILNALHRQPTIAKLLAVPCILGVNLTDMDLLEFLQQLADTDGASAIPPSVHRVLNNKACRGAIMFGDTLLPSECSLIVEELKQTSLCFQCAHGRPTTVPLVNLDALHKQINKLGLCSSGTHGSWHGLHRHEITLNRAACRLSSAID